MYGFNFSNAIELYSYNVSASMYYYVPHYTSYMHSLGFVAESNYGSIYFTFTQTNTSLTLSNSNYANAGSLLGYSYNFSASVNNCTLNVQASNSVCGVVAGTISGNYLHMGNVVTNDTSRKCIHSGSGNYGSNVTCSH